MDQRQFEQIARDMERRYGKIKKGTEEEHAMIMFPMESNLLKVNRKHPASNSRRLKEAIYLAFHKVNGYITGVQQDTGQFEDEENTRLLDAILMSFDPFTNDEIRGILTSQRIVDIESTEELAEYFREPVICLLRIRDSVEHWEKRKGSDGYFVFLEEWLGNKVDRDEKMNYSLMVSHEVLEEVENP